MPVKTKAMKQTQAEGSRVGIILNTIAAVISLAGLADATYLTVLALTGETAACGGSTGCFEVLGSGYAKIAGVPVAIIGIFGYFAAFSFATLAGFGYNRARGLFALTVWAMFAMTLWLLYVQAFVLHAFCRYCLFSAAFTFLLAGLVVAGPTPPASYGQE
ncbi:MAG: hypothetical protein QOC70_1749 [Verrucomicrobiota bacterium]|jgi:uncharacterized membrane protein